jgi:hypothetical protein
VMREAPGHLQTVTEPLPLTRGSARGAPWNRGSDQSWRRASEVRMVSKLAGTLARARSRRRVCDDREQPTDRARRAELGRGRVPRRLG